MLDTADRQEARVAELRIGRLTERWEALRRQMRQLQAIEQAVAAAPDHQVSLTDPDVRAIATNGNGTGMVGDNAQAVVDAKHHPIIAHEVTNLGHDKHQLANMARQAKDGAGPLPDTQAGQRPNRNEPARPRLQPETSRRCPRHSGADDGNEGVRAGSPFEGPECADSPRPTRVLTQPPPLTDIQIETPPRDGFPTSPVV
jgi:hypothetical protein